MSYVPDQKILDRYADVLVNFALNSGIGVKSGETVLLQVPECAKPILISLRRSVIKSGANPIIQYLPDDMSREFFELANEDQINFFPSKYLKGKINEIDHSISIIAETNKKELEGIDPKKIMQRGIAMKKYHEWTDEKEYSGRYTWTLALYGTEAMAKEANLSLEEYWEQIIKACFLDERKPVEKWKKIQDDIEVNIEKLNKLNIESLNIKSKNTDLNIKLGEKRKWIGGSGRNIPSFEIFTSPDWRGTNGYISFNEPLYRYGNLIEGIKLNFKDGRVTKASASKNEKVLLEMIKSPNADKIGEFSLTDRRFSRITKFMAETLFDENIGGKYGNTHLALGLSYKDCYDGDPKTIKSKEWESLGFNDSAVHTDIISTDNRIVTAILKNGEKRVIYKDGEFTL